jgi:signal transduction histidine kinase/PAS domain-containing protein
MPTEITYSTQIFLPSIISGVLLLSAVVVVLFFIRTRESSYLAITATLANSVVFVLLEALINYMGETRQVATGFQLTRIIQLSAAAYIPAIPWLIYSFGGFYHPALQRTVIVIATVAFLMLVVIAFAVPDLFISVTTVAREATLKESAIARGAPGVMYSIRDILLGCVLVYSLFMLPRLKKHEMSKSMAGPMLTGIVIAVILPLNDIVNAYTQHNLLLPPFLDFSYAALGMGIFGIAVTYGTFQRFMIQLTENRQKYLNAHNLIRDVVDTMESVVIGVDEHHCITLWNNKAMKRTASRAEQVIGKKVESVLPELLSELGHIDAAIHEKTAFNKELKRPLVNGDIEYDDLKILPLNSESGKGAVIITTNITDKKQFQQTLIQAEKMASLGGMASGMAHEINNPIAGILQSSQLAETRLTVANAANLKAAENAGISFSALQEYLADRRIPSMLAGIRDAGLKASQTIHGILNFSRRETGSVEHSSINEILDNAIRLIQNDWTPEDGIDFKSIHFVKHYDDVLPDVPCQIQNIRQAFFNILKNAAEAACETDPEPTVTVKTLFRNEKLVRIEIEDSGPGIPAETRQRVFDPFFTTKGRIKGTGLGLSVAYFIICEQHHGTLDISSVGATGGTRITVDLPLHSVNRN